jgi:YgiT-type zinc finger domain-containing protein
MDRYYFCRGRVVVRKIDHLHRWGDALLLVKGLRAEVCEECREVYLPPDSLHLLDNLVTKAEAPTEFIQIPVYSVS